MGKALKYITEADKRLKKIAESVSPQAHKSSEAVFEDLVSCVLDMQIHYRGNATRYKRLKKLLNGVPVTHENLFTIGDEGLKEINMSRQKYNALVSLCQYWDEHNLADKNWSTMSDDEVKTTLLDIKGVGQWSVDMILLFTLERADIFPTDDFHLKKVMINVYDLADDKTLKKEMKLIASDWVPYRSLAVGYLLAYRNQTK